MEVHGIAAAPMFVANSVIVDGAENYGFEDWVHFFEKYAKWSMKITSLCVVVKEI